MERLRTACLRVDSVTVGHKNELLGKDPVFEEALLNSKVQAFAQAICGGEPLLYQLACSVRSQGEAAIPTHADDVSLPMPVPKWETKVTACWVCDEFTEAGGCTKIIPGTHLNRRPPTSQESEADEGAIPAGVPTGICRSVATNRPSSPPLLTTPKNPTKITSNPPAPVTGPSKSKNAHITKNRRKIS